MTSAAAMDHALGREPARRVLTAVEFDVLWEWLGLGATPVVLRLDSPGRTYRERRGIVAAGWHALRRRGLADSAGPDPEIVRLMHLLAAPAAQVELRMRWDRELRVVAASRPEATVVAVRQDATVTLSGAPGPISAVLAELPRLPAGPGHPVSLLSADLAVATSAPGQPIDEVLIDRGLTTPDAELVAAVLRGTVRRGQLSVLAADQWGVLHRLAKVIGVLDTRRGRYLLVRDTDRSGTEWTTLAPTDLPRLRHRLDALLAEAQALAARA